MSVFLTFFANRPHDLTPLFFIKIWHKNPICFIYTLKSWGFCFRKRQREYCQTVHITEAWFCKSGPSQQAANHAIGAINYSAKLSPRPIGLRSTEHFLTPPRAEPVPQERSWQVLQHYFLVTSWLLFVGPCHTPCEILYIFRLILFHLHLLNQEYPRLTWQLTLF